MLRISSKIETIETGRRKEIIERAKELNIIVNDYIVNFQKANVNASVRTDLGYQFYKKLYKEDLNKEEKTILSLYLLFPEDCEFIKLYKRNNKDFEKIGNLYGVTSGFTALRYKSLLLMLKELNNEQNKTQKK